MCVMFYYNNNNICETCTDLGDFSRGCDFSGYCYFPWRGAVTVVFFQKDEIYLKAGRGDQNCSSVMRIFSELEVFRGSEIC